MNTVFLKSNLDTQYTKKNKTLKETFKQVTTDNTASCDFDTSHIAILPVRLSLKKTQNNPSDEFLCHSYTYNLLPDGWLYCIDNRNNKLYEYQVINNEFILKNIKHKKQNWELTGINNLDGIVITTKKNTRPVYKTISTYEGERLPYIRCLSDSNNIALFFSYIQISDDNIIRYIYSSPWKKIIPIHVYVSDGKIPSVDIQKRFTENGVIDFANKLLEEINFPIYNSKKLSSDIQELIDLLDIDQSTPYKSADIALKIEDLNNILNLINSPNNIDQTLENYFQHKYNNQCSNVTNDNKCLTSKEKIPSSTPDYSTITNIHIINAVKNILQEILDMNSNSYSDSTMSIKDINDVLDSTFLNKVQNLIDQDSLVENNCLNMIAKVQDPLGITADLISDLHNSSISTMSSNKEKIYENTIGETCFNILYNNVAVNKQQRAPYTYYKSEQDYLKVYSGIDTDKINKEKMINDLVEYEQTQYDRYINEYDLIQYLNKINRYSNDNTKYDFAKSLGIDCKKEDQYQFLAEHFSYIYTLLPDTPEGTKWLQEELAKPRSIGLLLYGFDKELANAIKEFAIKKEKAMLPSLNNDALNIDNLIKTNQLSFNIIINKKEVKKALSQKYNPVIKMLAKSYQNEPIRKLFTHVSICLATSLHSMKFIEHPGVLLAYPCILSSMTDVCEIKLNNHLEAQLELWKGKSLEAYEYNKFKSRIDKDVNSGILHMHVNPKNNQHGWNIKQGAIARQKELPKATDNYNQRLNKQEESLRYITTEKKSIYQIIYNSKSAPSNLEANPTHTNQNESNNTTNSKNYNSVIMTAIDLILNVWQGYRVFTAFNEKKSSLNKEERWKMIESISSISYSTLNTTLEILEKINESNFSNTSKLIGVTREKLPNYSSSTALSTLKKAVVRTNFIISIITLKQSFESLKTATTNAELIALGIQTYAACLSLCMSFAAIFGSLGPIGIIIDIVLIAITLIAGFLAQYFHRTDLQLWLEHCYYGIKKKEWHYDSIKQELYALSKILMTPKITLYKDCSLIRSTKTNDQNTILLDQILNNVIIDINFFNIITNKDIYISIFTNNIESTSKNVNVSSLSIKNCQIIIPIIKGNFELKMKISMPTPKDLIINPSSSFNNNDLSASKYDSTINYIYSLGDYSKTSLHKGIDRYLEKWEEIHENTFKINISGDVKLINHKDLQKKPSNITVDPTTPMSLLAHILAE